MKSKGQWEEIIQEYFEDIGREFDFNNTSESSKIFCVIKDDNGNYAMDSLAHKMKKMGEKVKDEKTQEQYDQEMQELFDNGCIQYVQPGTTSVKILKYKTIDDPELAQLKNIDVGEKAFVTDEPNHDLSFFQMLWLNVKAWFSDDAKRELASYNYLHDHPVKEVNLQEEQNAIAKKRYTEKAKQIASMSSIEKQAMIISDDTKVTVVSQVRERIERPQQIENRILSVFGNNPSNKFYNEDIIDVKALPSLGEKKLGFKSNEKGIAFLALCAGIGSHNVKSEDTYKIKETVLNQFLNGNNFANGDEIFSELVKTGRRKINLFNDGNKEMELNMLGMDVRNGIMMLNQMLNTSQPSELVNPDSSCFVAAQIISETMKVLSENQKLKAAASLNAHNEELAKGACAVHSIIQKSLESQKKLFDGDKTNLDYYASCISADAKLRGALAVNEFASYGAEKLAKLKNINIDTSLEDKIKLYQEVYPQKAFNAVIAKLGTNENYINENKQETELGKSIKTASVKDLKHILANGIKQEAELQSKKMIKQMQFTSDKSASTDLNAKHISKKENSVNM